MMKIVQHCQPISFYLNSWLFEFEGLEMTTAPAVTMDLEHPHVHIALEVTHACTQSQSLLRTASATLTKSMTFPVVIYETCADVKL
jgi:hypothetical protein